MNNKGYFLISLDFELQWGSFDKVSLNNKKQSELSQIPNVVDSILKLFIKYRISATWACVGMLLNKDGKEWLSNIPSTIPKYNNPKLSPYIYYAPLINKENFNRFFFALEIIQKIARFKTQEIASHTYSHYYLLAEGQTKENFKDDFNTCTKLFNQHNLNYETLVLPRNQFTPEILPTINQLNLKTIRINPRNWYWDIQKKDTPIKRIFRLIDTYNIFGYDKCIKPNKLYHLSRYPILLPSSRFFRPWSSFSLLNKLKLYRILLEMSFAAKFKRYYHLWWHPENFCLHPAECLNELEIILKHYTKLRKKYQFSSMNMVEFADVLTTKV